MELWKQFSAELKMWRTLCISSIWQWNLRIFAVPCLNWVGKNLLWKNVHMKENSKPLLQSLEPPQICSSLVLQSQYLSNVVKTRQNLHFWIFLKTTLAKSRVFLQVWGIRKTRWFILSVKTNKNKSKCWKVSALGSHHSQQTWNSMVKGYKCVT